MHGTAKQSAIARNAAITGIINGGAALYGTGFTIVLTNFNMTTMQITPSITSLLAIALGSLITAGLLTGGFSSCEDADTRRCCSRPSASSFPRCATL